MNVLAPTTPTFLAKTNFERITSKNDCGGFWKVEHPLTGAEIAKKSNKK
jgi:hypothetical protein